MIHENLKQVCWRAASKEQLVIGKGGWGEAHTFTISLVAASSTTAEPIKSYTPNSHQFHFVLFSKMSRPTISNDFIFKLTRNQLLYYSGLDINPYLEHKHYLKHKPLKHIFTWDHRNEENLGEHVETFPSLSTCVGRGKVLLQFVSHTDRTVVSNVHPCHVVSNPITW